MQQLHNAEKWLKGYHMKGYLGNTENDRGITLTVITAKVYNALLLNPIRLKIENILKKNQNDHNITGSDSPSNSHSLSISQTI